MKSNSSGLSPNINFTSAFDAGIPSQWEPKEKVFNEKASADSVSKLRFTSGAVIGLFPIFNNLITVV